MDRDENGQEFHQHLMLMREREEEEALKHIINGTATVKDAEVLAGATGHNFKQLLQAA